MSLSTDEDFTLVVRMGRLTFFNAKKFSESATFFAQVHVRESKSLCSLIVL